MEMKSLKLSSVQIEKLAGVENWKQWTANIRTFGLANGLGAIMARQEVPQFAADQREQKEVFEKEDGALWILIFFNVSSEIQGELLRETKNQLQGLKAWLYLNRTYGQRNIIQVMAIREKLNKMKLEEDGDMKKYLNTIQSLVDQLSEGEAAMSDKEIIVQIMKGLPDSYKAWVLSKANTTQTAADFMKELKEIANANLLISGLKGETVKDEAFAAKHYHKKSNFGQRQQNYHQNYRPQTPRHERDRDRDQGSHQRSQQQSRYAQKERVCYNCQKPGHIAKYCQNKKRETNGGEERYSFLTLYDQAGAPRGKFIVDSGASSHVCIHKDMFTSMEKRNDLMMVANGEKVKIEGVGTVELQVKNDRGELIKMNLDNVSYVPNLAANLWSVRATLAKGHKTVFADKGCYIDVRGEGREKIYFGEGKSLFELNTQETPKEESAYAVKATITKWHQRFGHLDKKMILRLSEKVNGLEIDRSEDDSDDYKDEDCDPCNKAKMPRKPFPNQSETRATRPLERIYSDIAGPIETSIEGYKYVINFIDDYSRYIWVYLMKSKSEALKMFLEFKADSSNPNWQLYRFRTDNGKEYLAKDFMEYLRELEVKKENTIPYSPEQNAPAERPWRSLFEMSRAELKTAGLPSKFWAKALKAAAYIKNRTLTSAIPEQKTPYELLYGKKPDVSHMKTFGCKVYVRKNIVHGKLDDRSEEGVFMGYAEHAKGYVIYMLERDKFEAHRNVKFIEDTFYDFNRREEPKTKAKEEKAEFKISFAYVPVVQRRVEPPAVQIEDQNVQIDDQEEQIEPPHAPVMQDEEPPQNQPAVIEIQNVVQHNVDDDDDDEQLLQDDRLKIVDVDDPDDEDYLPSEQEPQTPDNEIIINKKKKKTTVVVEKDSEEEADVSGYGTDDSNSSTFMVRTLQDKNLNRKSRQDLSIGEYAFMLSAIEGEDKQPVPTPKNYQEASANPIWKKPMDEEMKSHKENGTWKIVEPPKGVTPIQSKWTYRVKLNADGTVNKLKARLVAKGYTQEEGKDFNETYAPVAKFTTIRTMLAIAAAKNMNVNQADIKTAYLNAQIEEEIYMEQPEGYEVKGPQGQKLVCKLSKSIYGLKQAGRNWNKTLDKWLKENGFTQSKIDPCLYTLQSKEGYIAMAIYVDDLLTIDNNPHMLSKIMKMLNDKFKISQLGKAKWLLGMEITRTPQGIFLNQEKYINDLLKQYNMQDANSAKTPMIKPTPDNNNEKPVNQENFQKLVGHLIYLAVGTRPDIAYAVVKLSQQMHNPTQQDFINAKRILRYLIGTKKLGLFYSARGELKLQGYADADWAGDADRISISGYVFTLNGAAISWTSRKQHTVALSSTESEYYALCLAAQEAIYLKALLNDLKLVSKVEQVVIHQDNQGSMAIANNPISTRRSKHIDIKYHFIREKVEKKEIRLIHTPTKEMIADCLTKPVGHINLQRAIPKLLGPHKNNMPAASSGNFN
jgi:transposase InsO family protein